MRKIRLFLMAVLTTTLITHTYARNVGDRFQGYIPGTTNLDKVTYQITSIDEGNLTVAIYDTSLTGSVTFPGETCDSTATRFKVTSTLHDSFSGSAKNGITNVTFSEGMEELFSWTFRSFPNLQTVYFPKSISIYGDNNAIYDCRKLTAVNVHADNPYFKSVDGILYSKDGTALLHYPSGKTATTFTIPSTVTTVKNSVFTRALNLTSITIPATVASVETGFAIFCENLTTYNVASSNPNYSIVDGMLCDKAGTTLLSCPQGKSGSIVNSTIKVLAHDAFLTTHKITSVEFTAVEKVEGSAFNTLWGLKKIVFGPALTDVYSAVPFNWTYGLEEISFKGGNPNFSVDGSGVLYNADYTALIKSPDALTGDYTTHPNTQIIRPGAFQDSHKQSITITNKVERIMYYAFLGAYTSLITFNESAVLKQIDASAFKDMPNLASIMLPASLETINDGSVFSGCTALKSVTVKTGSQLNYIGSQTFNGCTALETFKFLGTHEAESLMIGDHAFAHCSSFVGASATDGFIFPKNTTKIGESAFNGCTSMTGVTFDNEAILETIGYCAFQNTGLLNVTLPESLKTIENEAFNSCQQLKTVDIPAATTSIGAQAFLFCGKLMSINVDKANPAYSSVDGMLASKDKKTLYSFPAGKAATYYTMLSPSFEVINDSAFYYCRDLKSVTIPKKVTKIGDYAFAICNNLERINFLANDPITDVHEEAFIDMERNSLLKNIDLYVRNGHGEAYRASSFWGTGKSKSVNEAFLVDENGHGNVEYFPLSPTDASIVDVHSDVHTFVVPEKVPGHPEYSVKLIGDYAFEDCTTDIEEVVVPKGVSLNYVGARAFIKDDASRKLIKNIFVVESSPSELATAAFGLHDDGVTENYDEVSTAQKIYVRKSAESAYKTAWNTMANLIDYKIPGISLTNTYGTFAREFDVDLADYFAENGSGRVFAFTTAPDKTFYEGSGDGNVPGTWYIRMYSINEGQNGDGTYIPAYTGVMLKSMGGAATPSEFYYTIGDSTTVNSDITGAVLVGVTVKPNAVVDTNKDIYVMSGGVFKPLNGKTVSNFPVHKAYLQLPSTTYPGAVAGAKLSFTFYDRFNDEVTEVDNLCLDGGLGTKDDTPVFDLQGRRVAVPQKGIYIKNGKKMVIK